jgi:putative endonuclease
MVPQLRWIPGSGCAGPGMTMRPNVPYYVYLMASRRNGTLYLGVTNDLVRRVYQHRNKLLPGFTARYGVDKLVWYEIYDDPTNAITREKDIKKWRRAWKIRLIEEMNPDWRDLGRHHAVKPRRHSGDGRRP